MLEPLTVTVDVENPLTAEVEVDPLALRPFQQMRPRRNREPCRLDGVVAVRWNVGNELREPGQLVPARFWIEQEGSVLAQHPLQALDQGGAVCPDFGI